MLLPNNSLICKNLTFCTLSRNKKLESSIYAEIGEKIGREPEPKQKILNMSRVLYVARGVPWRS